MNHANIAKCVHLRDAAPCCLRDTLPGYAREPRQVRLVLIGHYPARTQSEIIGCKFSSTPVQHMILVGFSGVSAK